MEMFRPGDRVRLTKSWRQAVPRLIIGTVLSREEIYTDISDKLIPVLFDDYGYEYVDGKGWDFHSFSPYDLELVKRKEPDWVV